MTNGFGRAVVHYVQINGLSGCVENCVQIRFPLPDRKFVCQRRKREKDSKQRTEREQRLLSFHLKNIELFSLYFFFSLLLSAFLFSFFFGRWFFSFSPDAIVFAVLGFIISLRQNKSHQKVMLMSNDTPKIYIMLCYTY